jgi:hypothetical protein
MVRVRLLLFAVAALACSMPLVAQAGPDPGPRLESMIFSPPALPVVLRLEPAELAPLPVEAPSVRPEPRPVAWSTGLRAFARR